MAGTVALEDPELPPLIPPVFNPLLLHLTGGDWPSKCLLCKCSPYLLSCQFSVIFTPSIKLVVSPTPRLKVINPLDLLILLAYADFFLGFLAVVAARPPRLASESTSKFSCNSCIESYSSAPCSRYWLEFCYSPWWNTYYVWNSASSC